MLYRKLGSGKFIVTGLIVLAATVVVIDAPTGQTQSGSPTIKEKSGSRRLRESFSGRLLELSPSGQPKLRPPALHQPPMGLMIPTQTEIIANHDRLMAGSLPLSMQLQAPLLDPIPPPLLPLPSRELTMPKVPEIRSNYDRLWAGSIQKKAASELTMIATAPGLAPKAIASPQMTKPFGAIESPVIPKPSNELPTLLSPGAVSNTIAGSKPSLDTQPSSPQEQVFILDRLPFVPLQGRSQRAPSIAIGTPSAYGKSWGSASIGLSLQSRTRFTNTGDGGLGIGFGLGDPKETVGLDVGVNVLDLIGDTGQDGSMSFKLHRRLSEDLAVAVGVNNAITWGETDGGSSVYAVASKMFRLTESVQAPFSRLYVSAGLGGGQYRSEADIDNDVDSVGLFGSVAVQVVPQMNAIAEWTGQDLTVGISVVPFGNLPLVITPAVTDITGNAGDGSRFILGIGYGFSF